MGVIQGSCLGPPVYSIMASDLRTTSDINQLFKHADDTTLISPEYTDIELHEEFDNIQKWATNNKMLINLDKTKELVFHRPNSRCFVLPPPVAV